MGQLHEYRAEITVNKKSELGYCNIFDEIYQSKIGKFAILSGISIREMK